MNRARLPLRIVATTLLGCYVGQLLHAADGTIWQPYRASASGNASVVPRPHQADDIHSGPIPEATTAVHFQSTITPPAAALFEDPPVVLDPTFADVDCVVAPGYAAPGPAVWQWRVLPEGVMWQSYWAGVREPRTSGAVFSNQNDVALLDVALGGRMAVLRYGTNQPRNPQGWELQIEGAGLPRLNLDENWDLESVDFRFGVPLIYARDNWKWKFSYYHLSAHLGDELAIRENRLNERINFSRDVLVAGLSVYPLPAWRWYAEAGWAFYTDGGSQPWEFQFGVDVAAPGPTGFEGTPFLALNGHLREEVDFGGNLVVQAGWLWRGITGRVLRTGLHYHNGKSSQFEFFDTFEQQIGGGIWADY